MATIPIRNRLLQLQSKDQCNGITQWIGTNQQRFDELFRCFTDPDKRLSEKAAWPISYTVTAHPAFIQKHWPAIIRNLKRTNIHTAVKRSSMRFLQCLDIPEKYRGSIMNICFAFVEDPKEAVAVKSFSLTVLANLAKFYPDIIPEIRLLINDQLANQSAGFKSRAINVLKQLDKI